MYPFLRLAMVTRAARRRPKLGVDEPGELRLTCLPLDLDMFGEMNNGRVLTLYDLGRFDHSIRSGVVGLLKPNGWGFAVGGASVRYRRRVRVFDRIRLVTKPLGRDDRWFYAQQAMEVRGEAVSAGLMRTCVTRRGGGLVATDEVAAKLGAADWRPELPGWVRTWIAGEADRPWPPVF